MMNKLLRFTTGQSPANVRNSRIWSLYTFQLCNAKVCSSLCIEILGCKKTIILKTKLSSFVLLPHMMYKVQQDVLFIYIYIYLILYPPDTGRVDELRFFGSCPGSTVAKPEMQSMFGGRASVILSNHTHTIDPPNIRDKFLQNSYKKMHQHFLK